VTSIPLPSSPGRTAAIQRTLAIILVLNAVVVAVKVVVGVRSGSLTVIGAAIESFLDALNNVIAMVIVAFAARGPDEDHPYGHDKFETMGAIAIVGFLSISCFELMRGAVVRLMDPAPFVSPSRTELLLLAGTAIINLVVVAYERQRGRELQSPLLMADAAHTAGDLAVTALAVASLAAARVGVLWADPVLAIVVALIIARSGWLILRVTVPVLVDERGAGSDTIRTAACAVPGVREARAIRSRTNSSGMVFADVTIAVDGALEVTRAHAIADAVERSVCAALGAADVTVHVEPD
jgi:cation diffusion facilitator family transporter